MSAVALSTSQIGREERPVTGNPEQSQLQDMESTDTKMSHSQDYRDRSGRSLENLSRNLSPHRSVNQSSQMVDMRRGTGDPFEHVQQSPSRGSSVEQNDLYGPDMTSSLDATNSGQICRYSTSILLDFRKPELMLWLATVVPPEHHCGDDRLKAQPYVTPVAYI